MGVKILALVYRDAARPAVERALRGIDPLPAERFLEIAPLHRTWSAAYYRGGPKDRRAWPDIRTWFEKIVVTACRRSLSKHPDDEAVYLLALDETTDNRHLWVADGKATGPRALFLALVDGVGYKREIDAKGRRRRVRREVEQEREAPFCPFVALASATGIPRIRLIDGTYEVDDEGELLWPKTRPKTGGLPPALRRGLASPRYRDRLDALYQLRDRRSRAALAALTAALDDPHHHVRHIAAMVAKEIGIADEALEAALFDRMGDDDAEVRAEAGAALATLLDDRKPLIERLMAELGSGKTDRQWAAGMALAACGSDARPAIGALTDLLKKRGRGAGDVKYGASHALSQLGDLPRRCADPLLAVMKTTRDTASDGHLRYFSCVALGNVRGASSKIAAAIAEQIDRSDRPAALPEMLSAVTAARRGPLLDRMLRCRGLAEGAIRVAREKLDSSPADLVDRLAPLLGGRAAERSAAAGALESLADTRPGEAALRLLLEDRSSAVRERAATSLRSARRGKTLEKQLGSIRRSDAAAAVRDAAAYALREIRG